MKIDPKSKKLIKAKYWRNGWLDRAKHPLPKTDADYLVAGGWSFGSSKMTHDDVLSQVVELSSGTNLAACASLLSTSLADRSVENRSYVSSVLQAQQVPKHSYSGKSRCPVCGLYGKQTVDQDILLFEKVMWGGVRLDDMSYIWLDLKLLSLAQKASRGTKDLEHLMSETAQSPNGLSASKFANSLKCIPGNKAEREMLCGILGICDILQHPEHPGFLNEYPLLRQRELPDQHYIDLEWPFCWYNSKFGVNHKALKKLKSATASKPLSRTPNA